MLRGAPCTLPTEPTGRAVDRLVGPEEVIRPETDRQSLEAIGRVNPRRCKLTREVIL
jgi:hypothetical protein